jgi:hypothetical protein
MWRSPRILALALATALTACGPNFGSDGSTPTEPAPRTQVRVWGFVRNASTGAPIAGTEVSIQKFSACVPVLQTARAEIGAGPREWGAPLSASS